jgi:DNA-binding NtrC family response regulator
VIERALILGHIPDACFSQNSAAIEPAPGEAESLQEVEKRHILSIMAATSGNKTEAARRLNISRKTLERKYAEWGIQ